MMDLVGVERDSSIKSPKRTQEIKGWKEGKKQN